MSYSNSSKDTVLLLSVGNPNSSQKKYPNFKRYVIRWFKGLKNFTIQKKVIYFLIIMIFCYYILYPKYRNRELHHKNNVNGGSDVEDQSEIYNSYEQFQDPTLQKLMKRQAHADKIRKMKLKYS